MVWLKPAAWRLLQMSKRACVSKSWDQAHVTFPTEKLQASGAHTLLNIARPLKVLYLGTAGSTVRIHVENRFNTYDFGGAKVRVGLVHMCGIWFLHGTPAWLVFWSDTLLASQYAVHHSHGMR